MSYVFELSPAVSTTRAIAVLVSALTGTATREGAQGLRKSKVRASGIAANSEAFCMQGVRHPAVTLAGDFSSAILDSPSPLEDHHPPFRSGIPSGSPAAPQTKPAQIQ